MIREKLSVLNTSNRLYNNTHVPIQNSTRVNVCTLFNKLVLFDDVDGNTRMTILQNKIIYMVLVFGPYNKATNAAGSVYAIPWMGPKSTTSFILIVRSFT